MKYHKELCAAAMPAHAERHRAQLERYARLFAGEGLPQRLAIFYAAHGRLVELAELPIASLLFDN